MRHCSKACLYVYVHTSAVRVNDLTRPRISKKNEKRQREICRIIKVNILVVRMIFDTRNGDAWSLDQNVINSCATPFFSTMYCSNRSITFSRFFYYSIIYTRHSFFIRFESMSRRSTCHRTVLCRRLIEEFLSFFFRVITIILTYTHEMKNGNSLIHI